MMPNDPRHAAHVSADALRAELRNCSATLRRATGKRHTFATVSPNWKATPMPNHVTGVPMIDPEMLRRIFDPAGCAECADLGHICRPCRKRRYERKLPWQVRLALAWPAWRDYQSDIVMVAGLAFVAGAFATVALALAL